MQLGVGSLDQQRGGKQGALHDMQRADTSASFCCPRIRLPPTPKGQDLTRYDSHCAGWMPHLLFSRANQVDCAPCILRFQLSQRPRLPKAVH